MEQIHRTLVTDFDRCCLGEVQGRVETNFGKEVCSFRGLLARVISLLPSSILSLENHPTKTKSKYTLSGLLPAFNSTLCLSIKLKGVSDVVTITVHFFYFTFANLGYFSDFIIAICGCGFAI